MHGLHGCEAYVLTQKKCETPSTADLRLKVSHYQLASGKQPHSELENHHVYWVYPLFLWSFSIAILIYQRVKTTFFEWSPPGHAILTLFVAFYLTFYSERLARFGRSTSDRRLFRRSILASLFKTTNHHQHPCIWLTFCCSQMWQRKQMKTYQFILKYLQENPRMSLISCGLRITFWVGKKIYPQTSHTPYPDYSVSVPPNIPMISHKSLQIGPSVHGSSIHQ